MKTAGFTLIELIITLAIVALLASLTVPVAQTAIRHQREEKLYAALQEVREAIDSYKRASDQGRIQRGAASPGYPPNLEILVEGVPDQLSPTHQKIFFLRQIPRDPMSSDPEAPPIATWGLRSYESEPDDPQEGEDVYDIHSLSTEAGLNGVPYRQW